MLALIIGAGAALAADPHIDFVERFGTNQMLVHFNTEANRTYVLQYSITINAGVWTNLTTVPAEPFPNHYILVAPATNAFGFYRLAATP